MMTYDDMLEIDIKRHTDTSIPLWSYTYQCEQDIHSTLPNAYSKQEAMDNLENLIDELIDTREYIKEMKESDLA